MELSNAVVVITGAGGGIGAAMARAFAARGATVVVNDLDAAACAEVAEEVDGLGVPGDAAGEAGVRELVERAMTEHGRIDMFCANAGVATVGDIDAPDADWERAWEINVRAHVRAARAVLPHWLERGSGHFLATVSAAGLLTMLGAAPYSVSKHAALAFAEWLAVTYGDQGIAVQALCPQGVRTDMLAGCDERGRALLEPEAISAEQAAETVVESLADKRFLILPHPEVADYYRRRAADPDRWQEHMRGVRQVWEAKFA